MFTNLLPLLQPALLLTVTMTHLKACDVSFLSRMKYHTNNSLEWCARLIGDEWFLSISLKMQAGESVLNNYCDGSEYWISVVGKKERLISNDALIFHRLLFNIIELDLLTWSSTVNASIFVMIGNFIFNLEDIQIYVRLAWLPPVFFTARARTSRKS